MKDSASRSLRLALRPRPASGSGKAGWTPRSSTSRYPTGTGLGSWERSTAVAWAAPFRPSC
jgi:hypothetical protein